MTRFLILLLALGFAQVAGASTYPNRDGSAEWLSRVNVVLNGNTSTVNVGPSAAGTPVPVSSDAATRVGGFGVRPAGAAGPYGGVLLDAKGDLVLGNTGKKVAVTATAPVSRAAFVRGIGAVVSGPAGALLLASAPLVVDWLSSRNVQVDPAGGFQKVGTDNEYACQPENYTFPYPIGSRQSLGCGEFPAGTVYLDFTADSSGNGGVCKVRNSCHESVVYASWGTTRSNQIGWVPASLNDIIEYMDAPEAPALTPSVVQQGVTKAGIDPFGAQYPSPQLSGPSSVPGARSQSSTSTRVISGTATEAPPGYSGATDPATRTTSTTSTHNVTYNDNRLTYNTVNNTTTTVTNTVTGASEAGTSTETVEDDAPEDSAPVDTPLPGVPKLYERKYPDGMVGIWNQKQQQLKDTSVGQLVTQLMPNVGDGGCPKWQIPLDVGIADYGVFDASIPCQYWAVIRIVLIVGSLFLARAIIFGG